MKTDEELHAGWARGERRHGERLVDRYLPAMKRFFANKVAEAQDVEDCVGSTFERVAAGLAQFRGDSSFRTYLYGTARNVLREYIRGRLRRKGEIDLETVHAADLGSSASSVLVHRGEQRLLLEALRSIPLDYQIALELVFFEGRTFAQIAEMLDLPPGTVASRVRRGKQRLEDAMAALAESPELLETTVGGMARWVASIRDQLADEGIGENT